MLYRNEKKDAYGFIHSIDMVVIDYYLFSSYEKASKKLLELFEGHEVKSSLGNEPNFRYQYYVDLIWCEGIVFHLGKWTNYDKTDKKWIKLDMIRLEVNPNKHLDSDLMSRVLGFIRTECSSGVLIRYDYAIDVPVDISDVLVINSRKEKGLYKGTRYFGRRHSHGYLKIYNKAKEQKEIDALTRIEYTYNGGEIPSWEKIVVRTPLTGENGSCGLSGVPRLYLDMLTEIQALGGQIEPYIERMHYHTWKKIEPYVFSGVQLQLDIKLLDELIGNINSVFILSESEPKVKEKREENIDLGADFVVVDAGDVMPWEDN